jgi:competence protein ComEC
LLVFASEKGTLIDLRLGERHLCWNQDFPPEQIAYSIQPNRLAGQRATHPQPLVGIAQEASFWFPALDVVFFPSQSQLSWGRGKPIVQANVQLDIGRKSEAKDSLFRVPSGFRVVF